MIMEKVKTAGGPEAPAKTPVRSLLVSQPEPKDTNSSYHKLAEKYNLKLDFRPFIQVEGVNSKEFILPKHKILKHTAVIFTSRNSVDHFFRIAKDLKAEIPADMKYFCVGDSTANYLQKYITVRKRKLFVGGRTAKDLFPLFDKNSSENFLYPCSDQRKDDIPNYMAKTGYSFTEAIAYRTVAADLSDLTHVYYDVIAFFSPSGIHSLFKNFPDFNQRNTRIAAFGPTTAKAVEEHGLHLDIQAPMPNAPSMTGAIELYIKEANELG
jgi:uroporphyrinogen-III synthase